MTDQAVSKIPQAELDKLTDQLIEKLKTVFDPEIPVDIYELGLIYKVDVSDEKDVAIDMTLTAPGCPVAGEMPGWVVTRSWSWKASSRAMSTWSSSRRGIPRG
jgi:metal-sulfur cluster biosynthetic enzyme